MPSPLPGMDPYIERLEVWSDFHGDLAAESRAALKERIQPRYVGRLVPRITYEIVEIEKPRGVRPDVGVWRRPGESRSERGGQTAVLTPAPVQKEICP